MKFNLYNNVILGSCLVMLPLVSSAQSNPADTSAKAKNSGALKVAVTHRSLDEVVISVNKFAEKSRRLPNQVMTIDKDRMAQANAPTMAELLQQSGGVNVQKSQLGGGSPVMRGFEANKVLMVVDGVRMNNAIYRGGHLQNVITVDNNMLDKVEMVFGSSSVIYGSDALGGVMHFITQKPVLSSNTSSKLFKANALTRYSSAYNEKTGHVDLNFGFNKWASLSSFTISDFGDLRQGNVRDEKYADWGKRPFYQGFENGADVMIANDNPLKQMLSGYSQYDFMQKVLFQPNDRISHTANFQFSNSSDINRYDRLTEMKGDRLKHAQWYYGPQERLLASYALNYNANAKLVDQSKVVMAYQNVKESRHNRGYGAAVLENRLERVNVLSLNADLTKRLGNNKLNYGAELNFNDVASRAYGKNITTDALTKINTRYPDGGSTFKTYALYLAHQWEISPKVMLNDGIRFSKVDLNAKFVDTAIMHFPFTSAKQHNSALSGNLGLVYLPNDNWKFSLLGSSGFRAPNIDDLGKVFDSSSKDAQIVVPNPDLKPEYTYNLEFGVQTRIGNKLSMEFTAYQTWLNNAIVVSDFQLNGQSQVMYNKVLSKVKACVNARRAYVNGVSAALSADLARFLNFNGNINYTYGRVINDAGNTPLDHIPPVFGRAALSFNRSKFSSEFFVNFNGGKPLSAYNLEGEDNLQYATADGTPSWYTLNLRAGYKVHKYIQVQAALENLMDQHYRVFASGVSAPGRNMVLTVRGTF